MDEQHRPGTPAADPLPGVSSRAPRPGFVKRLYLEERDAWRRRYRKHFKHAARALGLGFVAGFLFFLLQPGRETKALEFVARSLKDIRLEGPPLTLALTLFYHNARASAVAVAAGAVPFLFLPIFDPLLNGGVLGLLASVGKHQGLDVPRLFLTKVLPHGVFELTAVLYATSLGLHLSAEMGKKAVVSWRRRKGTHTQCVPFPEPAGPAGVARDIVRSFVLVVLPLLLVAAAIEGLITPLLD
ncbi:MAG TPA: stage II sporulation protein M [Candidatus Aminicenantes bacterium]|nr:stage II sporulation protein M [Candidatus Aminicenantes bacterium]